MQKGNIGVTTENIFPVIKKFLYSDRDIFLREIVSNAVDASQKLRTLARTGELKGEEGDLTVHVAVDREAGTITVSDHGIGMTGEEIDKFINQIAFSSAGEFLDKYKENAEAIIGHFGLGFYSAFMVSKQVEVVTKSWREGSQAVRWTCDGSPAYEMEECDKAERGTDIIMHVDDDSKEFLDEVTVGQLLQKYCRFLPVPVAFGKKKEWKDGKEVETAEDRIINTTDPLWIKKPSELKDEDYKSFYRDLYPGADEPLFWIHLNVDFPFHLTGVLYFPKVRQQVDLQRHKISLYQKQVFVTDDVQGILPDFLTLLHGVIDSPDIPLNVSRSYLQSDSNVKKISNYVMKKVADKLQSIFKNDRKAFEEKWDDLAIFIHYGMLSEADFYDKATPFALLKDTEGKYYTAEEYRTLVKDNQTDKDGTLICLYANDAEQQFAYIEQARNRGYVVLLLNSYLAPALLGLYEQKWEKSRLVRVDSDTIDRLIPKADETAHEELPDDKKSLLEAAFQTQMPQRDSLNWNVAVQPLGETADPLLITQSEQMRRMKEMSRLQPGMSFYGEMPDYMNLVLNSDHPLLRSILAATEQATGEALSPIGIQLAALNARRDALNAETKDKKWADVPQETKDTLTKVENDITVQEQKRTDTIGAAAKDNAAVHQLIDLALLRAGLLSGKQLDDFVRRSISMIK